MRFACTSLDEAIDVIDEEDPKNDQRGRLIAASYCLELLGEKIDAGTTPPQRPGPFSLN